MVPLSVWEAWGNCPSSPHLKKRSHPTNFVLEHSLLRAFQQLAVISLGLMQEEMLLACGLHSRRLLWKETHERKEHRSHMDQFKEGMASRTISMREEEREKNTQQKDICRESKQARH